MRNKFLNICISYILLNDSLLNRKISFVIYDVKYGAFIIPIMNSQILVTIYINLSENSSLRLCGSVLKITISCKYFSEC